MDKYKIIRKTRFLHIIVLITLSILMFACRMPLSAPGEGILNINISSADNTGSRSLGTILYVYSGQGPSGEIFSQETYDVSIQIGNLTAGEWSVQVKGYNSSGQMVIMGESPMTVQVYGETELNITLTPVEGEGSINVEASWNKEHILSPTVVAVIEAADGTKTNVNMPVSNDESAEALVSALPAGFYRVSIQLYDGGSLASGGVYTVMVVNGITSNTSIVFDNLNKTGERIMISDSSFTLAWDTDSSSEEAYRIYARTRGAYDWTFIEEQPASSGLKFVIDSSKLAFGTWEFAVSSIENGIESELHTSMDDSALPATGWYIDWIEI